MKYNKYIVSFVPGSSGRFVVELLDRMILQSNTPIIIGEDNSAHLNKIYTGNCMPSPNDERVFEYLKFDPINCKDFKFSYIFWCHVYPDFNVINSRFDDIGIILIKINHEDLPEIVSNSFFKNKKYIISKKSIPNLVAHRIDTNYQFLKDDVYPKNCLVLDYKEIYQKEIMLEKLKEFTGIEEVTNAVTDACNRYIEGRDRITKQFNLR
jgi:hypothetical protein